jgi:uncharacterized membrane protein YedE/YeeE
MQKIIEFIVGLLFGIGLLLSGMCNPAKVLAFLDLFGKWDPSLALVMGGAILVGVLAFTFIKKRDFNLLGGPLYLPKNNKIDRRLVIGALLFGAGWGLAGFCPGPALVSMFSQEPKALIFVLAMMLGMLIYEVAEHFIHQSVKR